MGCEPCPYSLSALTMGDLKLDKFAATLLEIRDTTLRVGEKILAGKSISDLTDPLVVELSGLSPRQASAVRRLIAIAVDCGLHDFLKLVDKSSEFEEGLMVLADGVDVAKLSTELQTELFGNNGWIARFSKYPPSDL